MPCRIYEVTTTGKNDKDCCKKKKKKKKNLLCVIPIKEMLPLLLGAPLIPIVLHQPPGHLVVVLHLAAVHSRHSQADGSTRPTALGSPVPLPG